MFSDISIAHLHKLTKFGGRSMDIRHGNVKFDFENLFTFEMANNHQGSVEHGKLIINAVAKIVDDHNLKAAIKFQFRDIKTFVHPDKLADKGNKHVSRFLSTELSESL